MKPLPFYEDSGCSTVIVGKKVSATGHVLVAHNEDDPNCYIQCHLVPRMKHSPEETITFPDGTAVIPQVEETWALYWTEYRALNGMPFADGFFNEWGVSVVSNGCNGSRSPIPGPQAGGIGYGLRRLIAERATSARHGVEVACALLDQFGYRSARSYTISDKDEAWVFQVIVGHNFAARRVGDDEVFYIPNWLTIRNIDFSDAFEATVEDKMIAEQQQLKAEFEKKKAIIEAEKELEVAKLAAEANIAKAQGDAQAVQVRAQAEANAIKSKSVEIARMLGFTILETVTEEGTVYDIDFTDKTDAEIKVISDYLKYAEYLEVWDGKLPTVLGSDNANVFIPVNPAA